MNCLPLPSTCLPPSKSDRETATPKAKQNPLRLLRKETLADPTEWDIGGGPVEGWPRRVSRTGKVRGGRGSHSSGSGAGSACAVGGQVTTGGTCWPGSETGNFQRQWDSPHSS